MRDTAAMSGTLHLVCGLPCAGKTTLARQLEQELKAVRLSPDEWLIAILGERVTREAADALRTPLEHRLLEHALQLLPLGIDVILENGFWVREERLEYRARAAAIGAPTRLHYLDVPVDVLLDRLEQRNAARPAGAFRIDPEELRAWAALFEPPTGDELQLGARPHP